jgi:hypothetical protein
MEDTNKDPNFMAQADPDKKLEEKFKSANQKLEEIQKGNALIVTSRTIQCLKLVMLRAGTGVYESMHNRENAICG